MIKRTGTRVPSVDAAASGEVSVDHGDASPSKALGRVLDELRHSKLTDQSTHRMTELSARSVRVLPRCTFGARRSALRLYFRTLRQLAVAVGDPTQDLVLPARSCS